MQAGRALAPAASALVVVAALVHHLQQHRQGNFSAITQGGSPSEVLCTAHDSHTVARWEVVVRHQQWDATHEQ